MFFIHTQLQVLLSIINKIYNNVNTKQQPYKLGLIILIIIIIMMTSLHIKTPESYIDLVTSIIMENNKK